MVLKMVPERLKGEQATIPENPLPTSSVELVAQDEATSTAKSPTYAMVQWKPAGRKDENPTKGISHSFYQ